MNRELIYKRELQHNLKCQRCGHCCTDSARITLTVIDIERIAHYTRNTYEFTRDQLTKEIDGFLMFKQSLPCVFWEEGVGCSIYEARPKVCRDFPFLHQIGSGEIDTYSCPAAEDAIVQKIAQEHMRK